MHCIHPSPLLLLHFGRLDELVSPTPEGTYMGKATVKAIFNIGKVSCHEMKRILMRE